MPFLFILIILHEYALSKVNSQSDSLFGKILSRLTFIVECIDRIYPEEVAEAISKIKAFLETTISVEIGWILVAVIVVGCAIALKKIKTSK